MSRMRNSMAVHVRQQSQRILEQLQKDDNQEAAILAARDVFPRAERPLLMCLFVTGRLQGEALRNVQRMGFVPVLGRN